MTLVRLCYLLAAQGDRAVIGRRLGGEALGLYAPAFQLFLMPATLFGMAGQKVLFPVMSSIQSERERLATAYLRAMAITAFLVVPTSTLLCVLTPEVIRVVFGPGWEGAVPVLQTLACAMYFRVSFNITISALRARAEVYTLAWRQLVYAVVVLTGAWYATPYGLGAVAAVIAVALGVQFLLAVQLALKTTGLGLGRFTVAHGPPLVLGLLAAGASWPLATWLRGADMPALVTLVLSSAFAVAVVGLVAWRLPRIGLGSHGLWWLGTFRKQLGKLSSAPGPDGS
jgi:PST family polysaccharide transporter